MSIKKERSIGKFTRSSDKGKRNYNLIPDELLDDMADLYTAGAEVHGKDNWREAKGQEAYESATESAFRHFLAWKRGETDENHKAAVVFNMYLRNNIK